MTVQPTAYATHAVSCSLSQWQHDTSDQFIRSLLHLLTFIPAIS